MMKLPTASADGTAPSGSSLAVTYPGAFGSRVGGTGRVLAAGGGVCGAALCALAVCADADAAVISAVTMPAISFAVFTMTMIVNRTTHCKSACPATARDLDQRAPPAATLRQAVVT
jgi:hypothetical protein